MQISNLTESCAPTTSEATNHNGEEKRRKFSMKSELGVWLGMSILECGSVAQPT